jgi:uncharacterized circularly permuted ATP-grasp superfamily protein
MSLALVAMSHSPLLELSEPPAELTADVETAFAAARKFIAEYDPELVVAAGSLQRVFLRADAAVLHRPRGHLDW